jgi:carbamoyltransferase
MYILGLWDGHDSGAALIRDNEIIFASNEERYTKRKLEVSFPYNSINAALKYEGIRPRDIEIVAFPTTDFAKTVSRIFPFQKESYYKFRRRKMLKPFGENIMHYTKYAITSIGTAPLCREISGHQIKRALNHIGFDDFRVEAIDHHMAHAATAAFTSGMKRCLVITLDGIGDGLSGSISTLNRGVLERVHSIGSRDSIGIFFEQVTNIIGMRELEDEGKVMAMADYSFPFEFNKNKLKDMFTVDGINIKARYEPISQYNMLSRIAWGMPREQFAYMSQQLLEHIVAEFVSNAIDEYGIHDVCFAGGVMSNIKANMKIRMLDNLNKWYIFPHMGDGGIALGAALYSNYQDNGVSAYEFGAYLGTEYSDDSIENMLKKNKDLDFEEDRTKTRHAAEILEDNDYIMWFQGRMEYGPRALGNRSILGNASSDSVKEMLNLYVKQREWYQPFCPSMLEDDSYKLLKGIKGIDRFMTMGYKINESKRDVMKSVVHVDMTARPQIVGNDNDIYRKLLMEVRKKMGYGVVLNTSFNIHGAPIVESPEDAIYTMKKTNSKYMFIGSYFVENRNTGGKRA